MNELFNVTTNGDKLTLSARDLHNQLQIHTKFNDWFSRMKEYGFDEGTDFYSFLSESTGGRPATDYQITLDMAKEEIAIDTNMENVIENDLLQAIIQQAKELGWLEEEKRATNFEHYFEYLSKLNMSDFALIDGRVVQCLGTHCRGCDFNGDCIERKFKWLKHPYKKLPYKLSQFEFDIIQTYRDCHESCKISEFKQLIELKDKGYFKCIDHDTKIQDVLKNCEVIQ